MKTGAKVFVIDPNDAVRHLWTSRARLNTRIFEALNRTGQFAIEVVSFTRGDAYLFHVPLPSEDQGLGFCPMVTFLSKSP